MGLEVDLRAYVLGGYVTSGGVGELDVSEGSDAEGELFVVGGVKMFVGGGSGYEE